jgi:hypothetical protein
MNENIDAFIQEHTCASIACIDAEGHPYCFNCFYAVDIYEGLLFFKSSLDTHHAAFLKFNPIIAGTILPDKLNKLQVKGIQMEGVILSQENALSKNASKLYYKAHPMAMAMGGEIWTIQINRIKYTDNTLGFGKKIIWERPVI